MEPIDVAISKAQYLFFTPRIRKTGQDIKTEIHSKFKDAATVKIDMLAARPEVNQPAVSRPLKRKERR